MTDLKLTGTTVYDTSWGTTAPSFSWTIGGSMSTYIDPKTLKPCKHKWEPAISASASGWSITPKCAKCGKTGKTTDKGVSLSKLVAQMGR